DRGEMTMPENQMTDRERHFLKRIRDLEARPTSDGGAAFLVGKVFERCRILEKRVEVLEKILRGRGEVIPAELPKPAPGSLLLAAAERRAPRIRKRESVANLAYF